MSTTWYRGFSFIDHRLYGVSGKTCYAYMSVPIPNELLPFGTIYAAKAMYSDRSDLVTDNYNSRVIASIEVLKQRRDRYRALYPLEFIV